MSKRSIKDFFSVIQDENSGSNDEEHIKLLDRIAWPCRQTSTAHPQGKRNQCWECARPVCTAQRKTPRSLLINDNCTIKRKTLLSACLRMMGSTTKTIFFSTKFAQNKGKTLCSLLVFTQLFRTRNKERSIFAQFTQVSGSWTCAYLKKWPRYAPDRGLVRDVRCVEGCGILVGNLQPLVGWVILWPAFAV